MTDDRLFTPYEAAVITGLLPERQRDLRKLGVLPPRSDEGWSRHTFRDVTCMAFLRACLDAGLKPLVAGRLWDSYGEACVAAASAFQRWGIDEAEEHAPLLVVANPRDSESEPACFVSFKSTLVSDLNNNRDLRSCVLIDLGKVGRSIVIRSRILDTGTGSGGGGGNDPENPNPINPPAEMVRA